MVERRKAMPVPTQEEILENQVPEYVEPIPEVAIPEYEEPTPEQTHSMVGKKLHYIEDGYGKVDMDEADRVAQEKHISRLGENIKMNAAIREGWLSVERGLLGERDAFYPESWEFRIKPATVEAIRNWSTIDSENPNSIDEVFNEILKECLAIKTPTGSLPWSAINSWDRFFFVLLIREYSMVTGDKKIEFVEECPNCGKDITFTLNSQALMYDLPGEDVMKYYNSDTRSWYIDPAEFDVDGEEPIILYNPTLDKDAAIKDWLFNKVQENNKAKIDRTFLRFLPWLTDKVSKDVTMAKQQIKRLEMKYKSWDAEMFSFMDDVLKNVAVTPDTHIKATCDSCEEEATAQIQFPDGVQSLFNMGNRHKKFGQK